LRPKDEKSLSTIIPRPGTELYIKTLLSTSDPEAYAALPLIGGAVRFGISAELAKAGTEEVLRAKWCETGCGLSIAGSW